MNVRKVPLIIGLTILTLSFSMFTLYMTMFNHGPPSEIMEANRHILLKPQNEVQLAVGEEDEEDEEVSESVQSAKRWQKFVDDNKYVAIGDVFDSCGECFFFAIPSCFSLCPHCLSPIFSHP